MLDPSADEIRAWGNSVIELMIDYLSEVGDRKIYGDFSSREIRDQLDDALPTNGGDFDNLLKAFRETIIPFSRQNAHPRMFGYVQSPGTPLAAFADLLASTLNANLTAWRSAPAPVELERLTIDWIRQILGFDSGAGGLLVSGGSMANFAALAAARQTKSESSSRLPSMPRVRHTFPSPRPQRCSESGGRMCGRSRSTKASESEQMTSSHR